MIIGPQVPDPHPDDIIRIDDRLADEGVPVLRRPIEATKIWGEEHDGIASALDKEGLFADAYRQLHPSVPFDSESFLTLCVSARGVSYSIKPPMGYGRVAIKPMDHTVITQGELARLYHRHEPDFFELHWQGFDAIDLFMSLVNYHPADKAASNMMDTAVNQMTASARQLIACELDSSLPQGMAMACELAAKSVLLHCGEDASRLKKIGHNVPQIIELIRDSGALATSPVQDDVDMVATMLPKYVEVRYNSPPMTMLDAQNLFRRSMFLIADLLRQTNHDQGYWRKLTDGDMPPRSF
ncbi:MAG: hypothetical protein VX454_01195 [Pseudomonadota bacterium]|jgi:hypothetical protein|nr:hypothetical protein [Pseudomonadota bacterium]